MSAIIISFYSIETTKPLKWILQNECKHIWRYVKTSSRFYWYLMQAATESYIEIRESMISGVIFRSRIGYGFGLSGIWTQGWNVLLILYKDLMSIERLGVNQSPIQRYFCTRNTTIIRVLYTTILLYIDNVWPEEHWYVHSVQSVYTYTCMSAQTEHRTETHSTVCMACERSESQSASPCT